MITGVVSNTVLLATSSISHWFEFLSTKSSHIGDEQLNMKNVQLTITRPKNVFKFICDPDYHVILCKCIHPFVHGYTTCMDIYILACTVHSYT